MAMGANSDVSGGRTDRPARVILAPRSTSRTVLPCGSQRPRFTVRTKETASQSATRASTIKMIDMNNSGRGMNHHRRNG
jgi:hypothetical protein